MNDNTSADTGYYILSGKWHETSAIRGDSGGPLINSARNVATVWFSLTPELFGGGGSRVSGKLTLEQAPIGDRIVK